MPKILYRGRGYNNPPTPHSPVLYEGEGMYKYFNPNPMQRKNVGDCTVRSIAKALNMSWDSAFIDLASQAFFNKDMPSSNSILSAYLHSKGFRRYAISNLCPDCYTFKDFANDHPVGTYIVGTGTHVACIKNGTLWDSWDSSSEIPIFYWRKDDANFQQ